jgi:outer membrane protein assembly factor BamA
MKLDVNLEYRTKLVGMLNGAIFVDAGNIWTLREYEEQPGGAFHFDSFLRQIAVSYGFGLRLNLDFFVLRFDGGMKAINPAYSPSSIDYIPLLHPDFGRDFTFHFAVGYPF